MTEHKVALFLKKDLHAVAGAMRAYSLICVLYMIIFSLGNTAMLLTNSVLVTTILLIGLMGLEEKNGGDYLLATLPAPKEDYVLAKFITALICIAASSAFTVVVGLVLNLFAHTSFGELLSLPFTILLVSMAMIFLAVVLPLILRFGARKMRVPVMLIFLVFFLSTGIIGEQVARRVLVTDMFSIVLSCILVVAAVVGCYISYRMCCKIVKTKQYC